MQQPLPSDADIPRPLHIKKQTKLGGTRQNVSKFQGHAQDLRNLGPRFGESTSLAGASDDTDDDQPLTVPKRRPTINKACGPDRRRRYNEFGRLESGDDSWDESAVVPKGRLSGEDNYPDHRSSSYEQPPRPRESLKPGLTTKASLMFFNHRNLDRSVEKTPVRMAAAHLGFPLVKQLSSYPTAHEPAQPGTSAFESLASLEPANSRTSQHSYVLAPSITVIPDAQSLNDGSADVWTAIEISTQLCLPYATHPERQISLKNSATGPELLLYGYLYDIQISILPVYNSTILEIIDDQTGPGKILHPGGRTLTLVHVRVPPSAQVSRGHVPECSDELLEELESQLRGTISEYLGIHLNYRHSGFPSLDVVSRGDIVNVYTKLTTSATAVIHRHEPASSWSTQLGSRPDLFFETLTAHWGWPVANKFICQIRASRLAHSSKAEPESSREPCLPESARDEQEHKRHGMAPPICAPPPIPRRRASLQRSLMEENTHSEQQDPEASTDPAHKIWSEIRRQSTEVQPNEPTSRVGHDPSVHMKDPVAALRQVRKRHSINFATAPSRRGRPAYELYNEPMHALSSHQVLQPRPEPINVPIGDAKQGSLASKLANMSLTGKGLESISTRKVSGRLDVNKTENVPPSRGGSLREKKDTGRWSWNGWWVQ